MFVYACNIKEKERYLIDHDENFSVGQLYNLLDITINKLSLNYQFPALPRLLINTHAVYPHLVLYQDFSIILVVTPGYPTHGFPQIISAV